MTHPSSSSGTANGTDRRVQEPPHTFAGILRQIGPGLIIAGAIVGSGELIATTLTGAQAGFWLLWLIICGCVIKVFVQVELGRYAIINGQTTLKGLVQVPGPRFRIALAPSTGRRLAGNWLLLYWILMFTAGVGQLGGIVGGVGQAMAISAPITDSGRRYNAAVEARTKRIIARHAAEALGNNPAAGQTGVAERASQQTALASLRSAAYDHKIWAAILAVVTSLLLIVGRYGFIQAVATVMVTAFTAVTLINLGALQMQPPYAVDWSEIVRGLSLRITPAREALGGSPLVTALATFGIIGVGASELVAYPYWCLEKGYAVHTGTRDGSAAWARRAAGWMRVMRWDAWCSMVIYTFATVAFYILGAAILGRIRLLPEGAEMIRTLAVMYEPVFGRWAQVLFLFGSFAVLYSTFFLANAANSRLLADALGVLGVASVEQGRYRARVRFFGGLLPLLSLVVYILFPKPTRLVLASGVMQAIMLPMLAGAALYFRFRMCDTRLRPGILWDVGLCTSSLGMLVAGGWLAASKLLSFF